MIHTKAVKGTCWIVQVIVTIHTSFIEISIEAVILRSGPGSSGKGAIPSPSYALAGQVRSGVYLS